MDQTFILEMKNIHKAFPGVKALDGVQLNVKKGTVHALMGENGAGKSTLMKCLFGIYKKDQGQILLEGKEVNFENSRHALDNGVSMVHQELNQVQTTRIMDNIWLGRFPMKGLFIDEDKMYKDTLEIFKNLDIDLDPKEKVGDMQVSEKQMVEIAKAVSYDSKILVMDEPTSSLTEKEVNHLFKIIRALRDRGVGIIYISHKMEELEQIADEVTIFRDGTWVATKDIKDISTDEIINLMVGRDLTHRFPPKTNLPKDVMMQVENITAKFQPSVKDISFDLRHGEILGIAGLVGSKRTDVLECLFGSRTVESGKIKLHGHVVNNSNPRRSIRNGFALITEERRETGIFAELDIKFNATLANIDQYNKKTLLLNNRHMIKDTDWVVDSMSVKTPTISTKIQSLSGGNQQKVIVGRWLLTEPEILLMDEPTRGIDVGAKYEIYQLMIDLADNGKGVIMVSSEMPELIGITDRILVMSDGRVAGIVNTAETTQEEIMRLAAKFL
ncbi:MULTISPECIES: galactose/methyl galactoside ABC transporter ATP-binding protein MglA [unclassified Fusibacter]|uniref:galactose/methyl galactoside ABC transporter ATP-binding protein MglA n=1 Tax=unclassified Fusibacter TaxID=2624464 RepID=UPI0010107B9C|nr:MULTISPECIES: galactose/methyl galactoside ABC transporter ATP-binding protein MglA [unclassified Fusibacter]MCK8060075.1 galactose/methyl galactoside ABC transporter ATP-binding protein MglA [Fusibacter sp. A2]NPE22217.1 galactose/methyl galactoside ABC transporter ATP-binding protein MglA [Fusibacter sp. A1]RXV60991.1 galactose/methyl galactoside ABC transporter ATP-binding protein MglA [Fusibacter sp. A1]